MTDNLWASYEQEEKLLVALQSIHGAPWECFDCRMPITPDTGWKPIVAFIQGSDGGGIARCIVDIRCSQCCRRRADTELGSWIRPEEA